MATIQERSTNLSRSTLFSLHSGPDSGPPVLLLHGMKFQAETWRELGTIEKLADAGFRVIALDMPGFGRSRAGPMNPNEVLCEFLKAENIKRPVLIGPSMGGQICLEFCLANPESVQALVLIGPVGIQENAGRLQEIDVPTLLIWGGEDSISPIENGRLLHKKLPQSTLVIFEGAPHPCYLEETKRWHQELLRFLQTCNL